MKYDIKQIDHWKAPPDNGVPLLTMPNCPLPLHSLAPRTIMGDYQWDKVRKRENMLQNYTCGISGVELGHGHTHLHEVYSIDWKNQTSKFERYVVLDPRLHTRFIHSGRALTLFEQDDPQMPKSAILTTLEYGFMLIQQWNMEHPDEEPLRVCSTILDWAKNPSLESRVNALIETYGIKFYDFDKSCFNKENWSKWKLIYNDKEYPTKFPTKKDWEEYFKPSEEPVDKPVEKLPQAINELDQMIEESLNGT